MYKKDASFRVWCARLTLGEKDLDRYIERGKKNRAMYNPNPKKEKIKVNLVYVDMKQSVSEYYQKNPKMYFKPTNSNSRKESIIAEILTEDNWDRLKMKDVMRDSVKLAKLDGVVGFCTYYQYFDDYFVERFDDSLENDDVITKCVPLKDLIKDPGYGWYDSPWIARKMLLPKDEIISRFKIRKEEEKRSIELREMVDIEDKKNIQYGGMDDVDQEQFKVGTVWEIEDRRSRKIMYRVKGISRFLGVKKMDYDFNSMWDFLYFNDIPDQTFVDSDYAYWKDQQEELNKYRSIRVEHANKGVAKYTYRGTDPLTDKQIKDLTSSQDSIVINLPINSELSAIQHANVDTGVDFAEQLVRSDIQLISRQAPRQPIGDKTATEVKANEIASQKLVNENQERLEEVCGRIAMKQLRLMQKHYTEQRVISMTEMTPDSFSKFKEIVGDNVEGDSKSPKLVFTNKDLGDKMRVKVEPGSTTKDDDQTRFQKIRMLINDAKGYPPLAQSLDNNAIIEEYTRAIGLYNFNVTKRPENPMAENEVLESGGGLLPHKDEDHDAHLLVHRSGPMTAEKQLHIAAHEMLKKQKESFEMAKMASQMMKQQSPLAQLAQLSGASFMGQQGPMNDPRLQANAQAAAQSPVGMVPNQPQNAG